MIFVEKFDKTYRVWKRFFDLNQQKKVQWRSEKGCLWNVELKCNIKKTRTIACRMTGTNVRNKHRLRKTVSYKHDRFIKQKNKDSEEIVHRIVIIFFNFCQSAPDLRNSNNIHGHRIALFYLVSGAYSVHTKCILKYVTRTYFILYTFTNTATVLISNIYNAQR